MHRFLSAAAAAFVRAVSSPPPAVPGGRALAAFTLAAIPLAACSGDSGGTSADTCGCTINGVAYACGTETCTDGERTACSETAEISIGGACTETPDSGSVTPTDAGKPDSAVLTDGGDGPKPDAAPPVDAGPACDKATTFPCGNLACKTGVEYCNTVLSSGPRCKALARASCADCDSSGEYLSFVSVSSNLCSGGKRVFCTDGATGGQMTWGCR
jgi:hypothetical protein